MFDSRMYFRSRKRFNGFHLPFFVSQHVEATQAMQRPQAHRHDVHRAAEDLLNNLLFHVGQVIQEHAYLSSFASDLWEHLLACRINDWGICDPNIETQFGERFF